MYPLRVAIFRHALALARDERNMDAAITSYDPNVEMLHGMWLLKDHPLAIVGGPRAVSAALVEHFGRA